MADAITIKALQDASLDAKSLEEVVNGDDTKQVTTRLGETYPSVKKAIRTTFENGGLPATPFDTKDKMLTEGASLADDDYAWVTDDTDDNNGLYIKRAGEWVKSNYDPKASALNDVVSTFGSIVARPEYIDGKAVLPYSATSGVVTSGTNADRQYLEIDVTGFDRLNITQAKTIIAGTGDEWRWIALDATKSNKLGVSDFNGVGLFKLPEGAAYVIRNSKISGNTDNTVEAIKSKGNSVIDELLTSTNTNSNSISSLKNDMTLLNRKLVAATSPDITVVPATLKIIEGATVRTDVTNIGTKDYLAFGSNRDYFSIDLVGASQLVIEKSGFKATGLDILFIDSDELLISKERSQENGVFDIPKGAVKALRTRKFPPASDYIESDAIEFKLRYNPITYDGLSITQIKEQVDLNTQRVLSLGIAEADAYDAYDKAQDIIAKSNKPVYKLSDFSGETSQDKIKDALSFIESAGKGILDLESGTHLLEEAIVLPSHCWLYLNDSTVKLADGTFDNIIRNKGIVPNPDPFKDSDINEDRDIRIFGNGNVRSFIEGQVVPKSAPSPIDGSVVTWTNDDFGWRTIGILFANVKDFQMHDFKMQSLHSWAISLGNGCDGFDVGHIEFDNRGENGDGVHLVNGASNGYIHDLSGRTRDDMVGITATRNFAKEPYPDRHYVYPMAVGGWDYSDNWSIDIHDITIERLNCWGGTQAVRILVNNQAKCYNISVNNVVSTRGHVRGMIIGTGWGIDSGWGDIYNIFINNLDVNTASVGLYLDAKIQNLIVNKLTMGKDTARAIGKTSKFAGQSVKVSNVNAHIGTDV